MRSWSFKVKSIALFFDKNRAISSDNETFESVTILYLNEVFLPSSGNRKHPKISPLYHDPIHNKDRWSKSLSPKLIPQNSPRP